jgi:hypothetical protein
MINSTSDSKQGSGDISSSATPPDGDGGAAAADTTRKYLYETLGPVVRNDMVLGVSEWYLLVRIPPPGWWWWWWLG